MMPVLPSFLITTRVGSTHQRRNLEEPMKVTYDPEVDVLHIVLSNAAIQETDEGKPGVIIDYDKDGNLIGLEILEASMRVENPRALEYAVMA